MLRDDVTFHNEASRSDSETSEPAKPVKVPKTSTAPMDQTSPQPDDEPDGIEDAYSTTSRKLNELARRAMVGDRAAFNQIISILADRLVPFLYRKTRDEATAWDVFHWTVDKIREKIVAGGYQDLGLFNAWAYAIVGNKLRGLNRDANKRRAGSIDGPNTSINLVSKEDGPEEQARRSEQVRLVRKCLARLPEVQQIIVVFKTQDDMTFKEIAGNLDIPVGTVVSRYNCAMEKLRQMLKEFER